MNTLRAPASLTRYRELERSLLSLRASTDSDDPDGADKILDEMEELWWQLTERERALLKSEGTQTWPPGSTKSEVT